MERKDRMKRFYSHLDWPGRGTISHLFSHFYKLDEVDDPSKANVIVWNGGEDIGTSIYSEQPVDRHIPFHKSKRDHDEIDMFNEFKSDKSKLLIGICRGAQLLNCLNGGSLWQDVNSHGTSHSMYDLFTGETLRVTSTHHQMMIPGPDAVIIGVSNESTYKNHEAGRELCKRSELIKDGKDIEIVWYPNTRSLCIQGHPEYVPGSRFADYTLALMQRYWAESVKSAA
jgi:GMP synthase-like glutamine amidotransferase